MEAGLDPETKAKLIASPEAILSDRDLMRALVDAREADLGDNVIDIRGRAMEALESRLDRLESAHETVIAAAYDNQSGTAVVHRAVLGLLECTDLADLVGALQSHIAPLLRIETLRLLVEHGPGLPRLPEDVIVLPEGAVELALAAGRRAPRGEDIQLRRAAIVTEPAHGRRVASEALIPLDLGQGRPPALILMGSADPSRFQPAHGTDLLRFFAQVFRLVLLDRLRA
ncbi:DUF484 family protein [Paracoccus zeaxanthinifaciens]|uniref:DUF484 family protein n=1 Tax=Paracoccus zeaxanthinifaciens TaxID=187400 RepID=UPI0003B6D47A|nr:DUF484 family protein [Paracoccus zeaxanthinifaciens]